MRISVGSDHRGFEVKEKLVETLHRLGHEISDEGTTNLESVDYPDFACIVSQKVSSGAADRGILICGTGIGMTITANKFPGVRAAVCMDVVTAEISRRHNDLNILCLAGDLLGKRDIDQLVETWLNTEFDGGRHARRLAKVAQVENECS
jgi:ribose 5-phosphate isomerase B